MDRIPPMDGCQRADFGLETAILAIFGSPRPILCPFSRGTLLGTA